MRAWTWTWMLVLACDGGASTPTDDTDAPADDTDSPAALDGGELYADHCEICHAADGTGGTGPDLTREMGKSDRQLIDIMQNGDGSMPPQDVSDEEAQAIVDWMRENF